MAKRTTSKKATRRAAAKKASHRRAPRRAGAARAGDPFARLEALARNLWWTWNPSAKRLFESLDPALWTATGQNPLKTIAGLNEVRREALRHDARFLGALSGVEAELRDYLRARTWFARTATPRQRRMRVAYYCMEYGLHECVPLYAGGLGILAADHLKSASDLGIPLTGVGVLWKFGYYRQEIDADADVRVLYPRTDPAEVPIVDTKKRFKVRIGRSEVAVKIWSLTIGRVTLYLLDTDLQENRPRDRALTHHLYGGDNEYRIRQEILLGVGGLKALDVLGVAPTVHHLNEGHAAFAPLERVRRLVAGGSDLEGAIDEVRASSVFTTHTPVPEGNDRFDVRLFNRYMKSYGPDLGLKPAELLALGREDESDQEEPFCMTVLALKLAERSNGVAELHGETSRGMWMKTFGASKPSGVPIGHVTNGIHPETWIADEARPFYDRRLRPKWVGAGPDDDWWAKAPKAPAEELWELRQTLRKRMIASLRERMRGQMVYHLDEPDYVNSLFDTLDEDALTIGFARRFALYKRAPLIFRNPKRLAALLGDADRPVQLIFAGKAHPMDEKGHEYVRTVARFCRKAPFRGRVFIIQNYDTSIGRLLTQGCDVWLNNPVRPMEASGTSGMKPPLNGGAELLHPRRLVARGLQPAQRLGDRRRLRLRPPARSRTASTPRRCTACWRRRSSRPSTTATAAACPGAGRR